MTLFVCILSEMFRLLIATLWIIPPCFVCAGVYNNYEQFYYHSHYWYYYHNSECLFGLLSIVSQDGRKYTFTMNNPLKRVYNYLTFQWDDGRLVLRTVSWNHAMLFISRPNYDSNRVYDSNSTIYFIDREPFYISSWLVLSPT